MKLACDEMIEIDEDTDSTPAVQFLRTIGVFYDGTYDDFVASFEQWRQNEKKGERYEHSSGIRGLSAVRSGGG